MRFRNHCRTGEPQLKPSRMKPMPPLFAPVGYLRRIPGFVRAYFVARKLDEFSEHLVRRGKLHRPANAVLSVDELYRLQDAKYDEERDKFFGERLAGLLESISEGDSGLDPEVKAITQMGLSDFETYIEILVALRGAFHRQYIIQAFDAMSQKNRPGALMAQARAKNAPRRFVLDSRLLEVLLQIPVEDSAEASAPSLGRTAAHGKAKPRLLRISDVQLDCEILGAHRAPERRHAHLRRALSSPLAHRGGVQAPQASPVA